ncbi:conserved protein of unknown function [Thermococcus nautili]|uniref:hypothetical protein n=1 Tax=Thermococcus nautili TaxID=195522 RepID=UPI0025524DB1|nr:hypothetical protein [Thermococcus nautili]CAI1493017.1 conserved protein of unknown function [Thermococcus nautili]
MDGTERVLRMLPAGGVLSLIQSDLESNGELFSLLVLRRLLERGETVFLFLYEPFRVFENNATTVGLNVRESLGKNLHIFDAFGSVYHLPREEDGIHQLSGYLDDSVFIIKLREWAVKTLESREWRNLWIFTDTSTGVCKLFRRPYLVYRMIWAMRELLLDSADTRGTVLTLSEQECPEISDLAYVTSDVVIETHVVNGRRVGIVTKGANEGEVLELFGGD